MPAPRKPQDHRSKQRTETLDEPVTFAFDGEDWTVTPGDATGLEFLAALEDEQIITALRLLLGHEQAQRLIRGRKAEDLEGFFDAMGEAVGSGNL
jgi:hypothetical protein